jgi:outer membrane protein assembly factor BamB
MCRVITGTSQGAVQTWHADAGSPLESVTTASGLPILALVCGEVAEPSGGGEVLALDAGGVHCFSQAMAPLWTAEVPGANSLALYSREKGYGIVVGTATGVLRAFSGDDGSPLWHDARAEGGPVTGLAAADIDADRRAEALFSTGGRILRAIELVPPVTHEKQGQ